VSSKKKTVVSLHKEDENAFLEKKYIFQPKGNGGYVTLADSKGNVQRVLLNKLSDVGDAVKRGPAPAAGRSYVGKTEAVLLDGDFLAKENYLKGGKIPVIITLKKEGDRSSKSAKLQEASLLGGVLQDSEVKRSLRLINAVSAEIPKEKLSKLEKSPLVDRVSLDRRVSILLYDSVPLINATQLWQTKDMWGRNITGENTTIAIIDTGVDYTHPDLGSCTTAEFLGDSCSKVAGGYDFVNGDEDPIDDQGHGTHVAGIAAGNGTIKGVAQNARIMAVKVLDSSGSGSESDVIAGIEYAVDPNQDGDYSDRVNIISMSLGGSGDPDDELSNAVDTAVEKGVVVVVAAGNSGPSAETVGSPGCAREALTVGAMCKPNQVGNDSYCNEAIAYFSSRGPTSTGGIKPDVVAPGVKICSALWGEADEDNLCFDEEHVKYSGTSMATPHVAGAAALLLQAHPEWSPQEVKSALMATAEDLGFEANTQGTGKIDAMRAYGARIATIPQSVSFGFVNSSFVSRNITVKNLVNYSVSLNLTVGALTDTLKGVNYSSASLNASYLTVSGNSQAVVLLTVNLSSGMDGVLEGEVTIAGENNSRYVVPFSLTKLSSLSVSLDGGGSEDLYPDFYLHNSDLSLDRSASQGFEFEGDSYTFRVPSGNYTVYALGDNGNASLEYILMGSVEVPVDSEVNFTLRLGDARPFTVEARALDGRDLALYEWEKGFSSYIGNESYSVSYVDPTIGGRTVYVSNKPDNSVDTDVVFRYMGIPEET
jgi:subtilisin family serine protease